MTQTYQKTFKNCATCKTWQGVREINPSEKIVNVASPITTGLCENQKGQDKLAFMNCEQWLTV